jgi:Protein of unknown function (DUF3618)
VTAVPPHRPMAEIEGEIARTRVELDLTLDALACELAPRHLVEKAANKVTQSMSAKRPGGIALGAFRADPVPLALIGLGVAWLVAENTGLSRGIMPGRGEHAAPGDTAGGGDAETPAGLSAERIAGAAPGAPRSTDESSRAAFERAGERIERTADSGERSCGAGERLSKRLQRNPLLFGLAAMVSGAAVAMVLPSSRRERKLLARAREDLWEKAEELGHRAADSVRSLAETPAGTADEG